eukprot:Em0001g539a
MATVLLCCGSYSSLVNCAGPPCDLVELLGMNLNYSAGDPYVITGLYSFYSNLDLDRRWRFRICQIQVDCGDPGTPLYSMRVGSTFLYQSSVTYTCNNGYYQSSGPAGGVRTCQNTGLWSGTAPVCTLCTNISNCIDIRCTNATNQQCAQCESNHGTGRGQIAYKNVGNTSCQALCSWKNGLCYPGVCPDIPSSCNCSVGFTSQDCLTMVTSPSLLSCTTTIQGNGSSVFSQNCAGNGSTPVYINFMPNSIVTNWMSYYVGPTPPPPFPAYINGFQVGINQSEIRTILSLLSNPSQPVSTVVFPCSNSAVSADNPFSGLLTCSMIASSRNLTTHNFMHGQSFIIEAYVIGGGYLDVVNLDTNATTRNYYVGVPSIGLASFVIDLLPPTHCSVSAGYCTYNQPMLQLDTYLKTTPGGGVLVQWGGWTDVPSGVLQYTITIYRLVPTGGGGGSNTALVENPQSVVNSTTVLHSDDIIVYAWSSVLPGDGAYSYVMRVQDFAGNVQLARRLVLLDVNSSLSVNSAAPLRVLSAVPESNLLWQNSTTPPVVVGGVGHFYDTNLQTVNWLAPVLSSSVGGSDGSVVQVWFQAIDFKMQRNVDYIYTYLDSSPPVLQSLWLQYGGQSLALLGSSSFLSLVGAFKTSDPHSGLVSITWSIATVNGGSLVATGTVPVNSTTVTSSHRRPSVSTGRGSLIRNRRQFLPVPVRDAVPKRECVRPAFRSRDNSSANQEHLSKLDCPPYGTYYITVVAYNQALQPSMAVCSDGITVDGRPPTFGGVVIPGATVYPGLVQTAAGQLWLIGANRGAILVTGYNPACAIASYPVLDLAPYPPQSNGSSVATITAAKACSLYKAFSPQGPTFVTTPPYAINISWTAQDNVGIRDYAVATARSSSQLSSATFNSTGRLPYFALGGSSYDVGSSFYVGIQAWDLPGSSVLVTVGPILVEVTPPVVNGSLSLSRVGDFVTVSWGSGTFSDPQDPFPLALDFAVGRSPYTTDVSDLPRSLRTNGSMHDNVMCFYRHVDIVVDATQLSATWQLQSGTSQVFVAVGTAPGLADIVGFKSAGTLTSYTFGNLTLSNGGRYYVTVAATNLCGKNVSASSDGVVALQGMRQALLGATVQDGSTGSDIDYQISSSTAAANWAFPVAISSHVSHYLWGLMVGVVTTTPTAALDRLVHGCRDNDGRARADLGPSPLLPALTVITPPSWVTTRLGCTMASAPLVWSGGHTPSPPIVSDVVSSLVQQTTQTDWKQLEYSSTSFSDIDYSSSPSSLGSLAHSEVQQVRLLGLADPGFQLAGPGALACGSTHPRPTPFGGAHGMQSMGDCRLAAPRGGCVQIVPGACSPCPLQRVSNRPGPGICELNCGGLESFQEVQSSVHISGVAYYQYAIGES